jgi:hypothetical protein
MPLVAGPKGPSPFYELWVDALIEMIWKEPSYEVWSGKLSRTTDACALNGVLLNKLNTSGIIKRVLEG